MTSERLEAIREHLEKTGYSPIFKPEAFELLAEVGQLRAGIDRAMQNLAANGQHDAIDVIAGHLPYLTEKDADEQG